MSGPVKILGDITDVNINNFAWMASGYKPGDDAYEEALVRLLSRGGDELRGVSDPLEKIFSAVSSYIEEYGMTPALRNQHTKITEALSEGRTISDFNKTYYEAMQYGETLRIAPEPTIPPKVSSSEPEPKLRGTLVDKRAASGAVPDPTPAPAPPAAVPEPSVDSEPKLRGSLVDKRAAAAAAPTPVDGPKPLVQPLEKDIKKFDWRNRRKNWKTPAKNANLNDGRRASS